MLRLSKIQGLQIYNDKAKYVGSVRDILLSDEEGKVVGLVLGKRGNTLLSLPFSQVLAIGDIILARSSASLKETSSG
ncbi:MAG: PRC-barrel domain-containing protein [Candidatus Hadarchaeales archaeon]